MANSSARAVVYFLFAITLLVQRSPTVTSAITTSENDNVAVQWNRLFCNLYCTSSGLLIEPSIIFSQLHLAQWHALLALKDTGVRVSIEEAVVAYASHKILANYFPFQLDLAIDPLLQGQLNALQLSESEEKLGKRLGQAVAIDLLRKRIPAREFSLRALKAALDDRVNHLIPGVYRYSNTTPAGREGALFVLHNVVTQQPYVVPDPEEFIATYLSEIKPVKVPSKEWNEQYEMSKVIGRAGPGRPLDWNITGQVYSACSSSSPISCQTETRWAAITRAVLPKHTSLYDTVVLFAKLGVSMHDAWIVNSNLQFGFWFWRPEMAYKTGDSDHAPIPDWTPFLRTPPHAEYPSGTVSVVTTAATVLQNFFGKDEVAYSMQTGGVGPNCFPAGVVTRQYKSFSEQVKEAQLARMYAGVHFNKSVVDSVTVGTTIGNYIEKHWLRVPPSGVLPDTPYLNVHAKLPDKQGDWSPFKLEL